MMTNENMQQQFEAWFTDGIGKLERIPGGYALMSAQTAWISWQAATAQAVPDGWQVVPVEPTDEMIHAANEGDRAYTLRNFGTIPTVQQGPYDHWCAMLAAAPKVTE